MLNYVKHSDGQSVCTPSTFGEHLLQESGDVLNFLQAHGVPSERIVIAGFSQGGAVAYEVALRHPKKLAGLMALSTYFATQDSVALSEANQGLPVFIAHGQFDPMVPEAGGSQAAQALEGKGYQPAYKTYPMEHAVCLEEIQDIAAFLKQVLA